MITQKQINSSVTCKTTNASRIKQGELSGKPLILSHNPWKNAQPPVIFFDIKKPKWWQFWKKKEYLKAIENEEKRLREFLGGPSKLAEKISINKNN